MKHHLSSFRRSTALRVLCILVLAIMCAPAAMAAAASAPAGLPIASSSHAGSAFLAAGLGGMIMLRSAADDNGGDNGGGGKAATESLDIDAAMADIEDRTIPLTKRLSIAQRIGVAFKTLQGQAPAEQFTKVSADLATTQAALKAKEKELSDARARISALEADAAENEKTITALGQENKDLKAKEQDLEKRASEKAKSIVRGVGIEANKLPAAQGAEDNQPTAEERIKQLTGNKRTEAALYFKQHKKLPEWMA